MDVFTDIASPEQRMFLAMLALAATIVVLALILGLLGRRR